MPCGITPRPPGPTTCTAQQRQVATQQQAAARGSCRGLRAAALAAAGGSADLHVHRALPIHNPELQSSCTCRWWAAARPGPHAGTR